MKTYLDKLTETLSASQFVARNAENDKLETEKEISSGLRQLMNQGKIREKFY